MLCVVTFESIEFTDIQKMSVAEKYSDDGTLMRCGENFFLLQLVFHKIIVNTLGEEVGGTVFPVHSFFIWLAIST